MSAKRPKHYQRVLLKLSGEALTNPGEYGYDGDILKSIGRSVAEAAQDGTQISIVIGAGNILRGRDVTAIDVERTSADTMGMLATVMNAIALQNVIEQAGTLSRVQSAIAMPQIAEPYIRRRAIRHMEKGRVVIFAAGTGNPYFTTDTAAALRALEIEADVLLKGTKVDGVYDSDPVQNPKAKRFEHVTYAEAIGQELGIMDGTAFTMCRDNELPVVVFNILEEHSLKRVLNGEAIGTTVGT